MRVVKNCWALKTLVLVTAGFFLNFPVFGQPFKQIIRGYSTIKIQSGNIEALNANNPSDNQSTCTIQLGSSVYSEAKPDWVVNNVDYTQVMVVADDKAVIQDGSCPPGAQVLVPTQILLTEVSRLSSEEQKQVLGNKMPLKFFVF